MRWGTEQGNGASLNFGVALRAEKLAPKETTEAEPKAELKVSTFDFNGLSLRVVPIDGEPWFVGTDAIKALGLVAPSYAYGRLGEDETRYVGRTHLGLPEGRQMRLVSESGLYKLITRSDKPEAKPFQEWITRDVLPSVRKTGSYSLTDGNEHTPAVAELWTVTVW